MIELNKFETDSVSAASFSSGEKAGEAAGAEARQAFDGALTAIQILKWILV